MQQLRQIWTYVQQHPLRVKQFTMVCMLGIMISRWLSGISLYGLQAPVALNPEADYVYFVGLGLGIWDWILSVEGSIVTELTVSFLFALQAIFPKKRLFSIISFVVFPLYVMAFNVAYTQHIHTLLGMWWIQVLWIVKPLTPAFFNTLSLLRLYAVFAYSSAGWWKLFRGSWHTDQLPTIYIQQEVAYATPVGEWQMGVWVLQHPLLFQLIWIGVMLWQLSLSIGFFTRKYDTWWVMSVLVFHGMAAWLLHVHIAPLAILLCAFIPFKEAGSLKI